MAAPPSQPGSRPRRWSELSSVALSQLFQTDPACVGLMPVGAIEQHGPHLPTGTDTIIAMAIADAVSAADGSIALPPIPVGASWWHGTEHGGTLALAGEKVCELAVEHAQWAMHTGLRRLLFVNGHVGNSAPLWLACDRLRFQQPQLQVGVLEWWTLSPAITAQAALDAQDWHAHRAETALMLAIAPQLVDLAAAATADEPDRSADLVFGYPVAGMSVTGVTGRPSQATTELGNELWAAVLKAAIALVARGRVEVAPLGPAAGNSRPSAEQPD